MGENKFQDTIKACSTCLLCRHACTVINVTLRDTNLPRGKALLLLALQKGLQDWDERAVEVVHQCTNCHLRREWCPPGWDIAPLMVAARGEVVDAGLTPAAALEVKQNFESYGNPYVGVLCHKEPCLRACNLFKYPSSEIRQGTPAF